MPQVTLNIANAGVPLASGGTSFGGHMWFSLSNGESNPESFGWGPDGVSRIDNSEYINNSTSVTFDLTQEQFNEMRNFGLDPSSSGYDIDGDSYNPFTNSCIDFTWDALKKAGIDPGSTDGIILPEPYKDKLKDLFEDQKNSGQYENNKVDPNARPWWERAKDFIIRRDPLTLDLDGDGLETTGTGLTNPIYFDQDGDGVKTSSGWVKPDDGFLVLDRNSNGTIDNGRELFGDSTIKSNGQTASDGFDALADLDSNADGKVDANDTQFSNLRIWRDLNQDGISQSNELLTLASQNIIGINVAKTANSQTLPNGNQIADKGTFIKSDGSLGELDAITGNMADINLAEDTFHRQFPDVLDTTSVATLPNMQGSGKVRDLREAATQSTTLQTLLTNYSAATTHTAQVALVDQLLDAWADTGGMAETMAQRVAAMTGYTKANGTVIPYTLINNLSAEWQQKLHIIETFNGAYFFGLPGTTQTQGAIAGLTIATPNAGSTSVQITVNLNQEQLDLLQQSYDAIRGSVYDALLLQTRFKPILDQIDLVIDANGVNLDFSQVNAAFETKIGQDAALGMADLIEFNRITKAMLAGTGWQGYDLLETKLRTLPITPDLQAIYDELNVKILSSSSSWSGTAKDEVFVAGAFADYINAGAGSDVIYAGAGNDSINGDADNDNLYGQDGNDYINGGSGNDLLVGGEGNDELNGGTGNDIYLFNLGDGQDIIRNNSNAGFGVIELDTIQFGEGITVADVKLSRDSYNRLVVEIANTADKLTIYGYFDSDATTNLAVQGIRFADGTTWSVADVKAKVLSSTAGDDYIVGSGINDNLSGADGSDYLIGKDGNDTLDGGAGSDTLDAGAGDDSLLGGAGNDTLYGGAGNDTLDGNSENDTLSGFSGNDTLNGGSQNDLLYGDAGNDSLNGGSEDDILYGGADNDNLQGDDGNDHLYGDAGDDVLNGGLGNDFLNGGDGYNTYFFAIGDGQDTIENNTAGHYDTLSLAVGILTTDVTLVRVMDDLEIRINNSADKVTVKNHFTTSPLTLVQFHDGISWYKADLDSQLNTSATTGNDVIGGRSLADSISGLAGFDSIYGYGGNDTLSGGDNNDILYGGDDNDILNGDAGSDTLYGGEGNDTLDGGNGNDTLIGGNGNDTYLYNLGDGIATGVDTIEEVANTLTSLDKVNFGAGITTSNTTYYKTGNDLQFRFTLYDYLTIKNFFLTTDDQYKVEQFVFTDGSVWTSQDIQGFLTTPTTGHDNLAGYDFAEHIDGLEGNDKILGNGGDDTLIGGQGYDSLNGGAGNDWLDGGLNNDMITGGNGNDTLIGGTGDDILAGEAGDDVYQYQQGDGLDSITDTSGNDLLLLGTGILPAEVSLLRDGSKLFLVLNGTEILMKLQNDQIETIQFQNGTTWNLATIQANTVFGAVNTFTGTAGNDNYTVDNNSDVINEAVDEGTDSVTSSVTYQLGANIENLTLTGFLDLSASGNNLDNIITGNSGNNLINGGGYYLGYSPYDGYDVLIGGAGDDIYYATGGDLVIELVGEGIDTIYTSSSGYIMQDNIENLIIVGQYQYAMTAYGNSLNNNIQARSNYYGQIIDGGAGADTMTGGYDTTFYVDNIGDVVGGAGNFKVYSSVDFTLAEHWDGVYFNNITETIVLTGSDAINATGNAGKNLLDGSQNSAVNILEGGAGDDTYYMSENDIIIELEDGGNDTLIVYSGSPYAGWYKAGNNIENLTVSNLSSNPANLEGGDNDNILQGNNGVNHIKGLGGNDRIYGTMGGAFDGGDTLDGGDGNDYVYGSGWLYGGSGDDILSARFSSVLTGGTGNDTMSANGVDTYLYARGDGSDTIRDFTSILNNYSNFTDTINFGVGITENDILLSRSGDNLIISIAGTNDTITVEEHFAPDVGNVSRSIEQLNFINGANWDLAEILIRASSNNQITESTDYVVGTFNNDLIKTLGGNDFVVAGEGDDTIEGGAGNDTLLGNSGVDVLVGGEGDDTLQGGIGADTYKFGRGAGSDLIIDPKNNLEIDSILLDVDIDPSQIIVRRRTDDNGLTNDLIISIVNDASQITIKNFYYYDSILNSKQVVFANGTVWDEHQLRSMATSYYGTSGDDVLNDTFDSDTLYGLEGNDTLHGAYGNDTLDGGLGADAMFGGIEDDTYVVDNVADTVTEGAGEGYDTVESSITYTLGSNLENLILTGNIDINGTGNTLDNDIKGNSANNILNGGAGADYMEGGLGDDIYIVDNINDYIYEAENEGIDTVQSKVTYSIDSSDIENLTLTGTSAINGTGNFLNNILIGNSANNRLTGGEGNDTLDGSTGNDTMVGGEGDDVYFVNVSTDVVTELANEGVDTVNSAVTYTIASLANIENITLTGTAAINATGNAQDNVLTGNTGNNTITGGAGNDTLEGGLGIDTLVGGLGDDTYIYYSGQGNDQIDNAATDNATAIDTLYLAYILPADVVLSRVVSDLVVTINASTTVTVKNYFAAGNSKIDQIVFEDETTWDQTDIQLLVPSIPTTGDDNLTGTSGNDTIDALAGNDTVSGGDGNDQLLGNSGNDSLDGGNGADTLNGGAGSDTMIGGLGDDVYTVDVAADVVIEAASAGTDTVNVAISTTNGTYTLGSNVENGTLTNTVAFTLTGNALDNVLTGNAAANTLNGGDGNDTLDGLAGNDTMIGGLGNDTYTIGATGDVVTEAASAGTDTVSVAIATASGTYTVAANVENAILTNTVAYNLTGNALANFLKGNAANNTLTDTAGGNDILQGLAGIDTLNDTVGNNLFDGGVGNDVVTGGSGREIFIGGTGNDTITTGTGYDIISFNKGDGQDTINASTGADNTLSLGGNFAYSDLSFTKTGNNLILKMGTTDQITFTNWYASSPTNKSVVNLQVIAEAIQGFSLGGADALRDNKIENFNFTNLVAAFDAAGATANWQLTDARLTSHLQAGSDSAAIGGDLAYQYGKNSNLTGMGLLNAQSVIADVSFGQLAQTLNNPSAWQAEGVKLG